MRPISHRRQAQRGAATLVVVMMLFLIMALLAAYANRSLVFEQRISGSYYRASMAQELAEGGLDWTVAMLNAAATDDTCQPSTAAAGGKRFVDRYLAVSAVDRDTKRLGNKDLFDVDCVRTDKGFTCSCADPDARVKRIAVTVSDALVPSVGMKLVAKSPNYEHSSFVLNSRGCSVGSIDACTDETAEGLSQKTISTHQQWVTLALVGAVPSSPASPLIVKGALTTSGVGGLGLHNTDSQSSGGLVVSGGAPPTLNDDRMDSLPGTPSSQARVFNDLTLQGLTSDKLFQVYLGMVPNRYVNHPALKQVTCTAGDCGPDLKSAYDAGKRILWVKGDMKIGSNVDVGTAADPLLIVVNGKAVLEGPMKLTGMLVAKNLDWTNTSGNLSMISGSVLVTGDMTAAGRMDIHYQQAVADQLRNRLGSYVRVAGSWIDGINK